mmetsp:Transcript_16872/g.21344  ORF Transcript_16872/g.21344 Transcript_16872/m.21344 type:complete len:215 (-) Transcript_16872:59-703(-)
MFCGNRISSIVLDAALLVLVLTVAMVGVGLGSARLDSAELNVAHTSPQVEISHKCGTGVFKCYGEGGTSTGDFSGADIVPVGGDQELREEIGIVSLYPKSNKGLITVNITAPNPTLPGGVFREFEICYPVPLNGMLRHEPTRYSCATTVRNDDGEPSVIIDMVYNSCNEWTKIVRNLGSNPGVFWVNCVKKEVAEEVGAEGEADGEKELSDLVH